ncbi:MAG: hypothetical protein JXA37_02555 [Chloroflexia bacterium]|nr:hypothetical protein [Chloroflexia bacterium]
MAELLDAVSADRRRRLLVRERALPPEFSALWLATNIHDLIVVAMGLSRLQRDLAVAHECSHMLLEHGSQVLTTPKQLEQALSTTEALFVLARSGCGYDEEQERAAELLATEICLRLDSDTGPSGDKTEWFQRHIS